MINCNSRSVNSDKYNGTDPINPIINGSLRYCFHHVQKMLGRSGSGRLMVVTGRGGTEMGMQHPSPPRSLNHVLRPSLGMLLHRKSVLSSSPDELLELTGAAIVDGHCSLWGP